MFRFGANLKLGFGLASTGAVIFNALNSTSSTVNASDDALQPAAYQWPHDAPFASFDHASIRRGYLVYKQVCATCHSLDRIAFRNLVDTSFTEDEAKAMAAAETYQDGPDAEGEMFERPGKLSDYMPRPYPNENAARFANNGAYPPDLSLIIKARARREDYLFALLTGYREAPAGVSIREGLHYNPYFPGGAIAMAQALNDGQVEYDDGTEASISQMAKDVSTFLAWAAEPEHDARKRMGLKSMLILGMIAAPMFYYKKLKWHTLKARVIQFQK